jgi:NADH dehydrogenase
VRVAIIGGTGFVGSYLVDELIARGHKPVVLVRPGSESKVSQARHCELVPGDVSDEAAIRRCLRGAEAAIYNIGILREMPAQGVTFKALQEDAAVRVIDLAKAENVRRFILMSANGVRADGTPYQRTKAAAEAHLRQSGLDWTIFRPSLVFGDPRGRLEFCTQMRDDVIDKPLPVPLFHEGASPRGAGTFEMAPVHVRDVASAFVAALGEPATVGQTYVLCGPESLPWKEILARIAQACGKRKLMLPAPAAPVRLLGSLLDRFAWFPLTRDQLNMLLEGNTGDSSAVFKLLSIEPRRFSQEQLAYLQSDPAGRG